ncbi:unnamed protein product [Brachionus calyciflorus]|uniref:BTB domain-containing protein n=1 Tax=Brachionus calyciflorus TaxID=104777 RepID=A0A813TBY6_9BILA|nr:unnamed protein product [Brachionus calyciflorus]
MNVNFDDLCLVLDGAALTIQSAWRKYKFRQALSLKINIKRLRHSLEHETYESEPSFVSSSISPSETESQTFLKNFSIYCLKSNFLCDVSIYVNNKIYLCHSVVLWCNSRYFKSLLEKYENRCEIEDVRNFKFQVLCSNDCWEIVQNYMYGFDVTIKKGLLDELIYVTKQLKIDSLLDELTELLNRTESRECVFENLNKNQNCNSSSNASIPVTLSTFSISDNQEILTMNSKQPFQLISSYYKFFKCVVNFYRQKRLSLSKTLYYLSTNYIDYTKMSESQLNKCLLMLKTHLKLCNSDLIVQIIDIYLNKVF